VNPQVEASCANSFRSHWGFSRVLLHHLFRIDHKRRADIRLCTGATGL
jgi:hypothetical protein